MTEFVENRFMSSPDEIFKAFAQAMADDKFNETVLGEHPRMLNRVDVENDGGYNDYWAIEEDGKFKRFGVVPL